MHRVAIVTGGSRGIGREAARELASCGYAVAVGYAHDQGEADAVVDGILAAGGIAIAIRADVTDELDVERLFTETTAAFGGVDLVVHAAPEGGGFVALEATLHLRPGGAVVDPRGLIAAAVDMRLEVVVLPVADVERAKAFYASLGWRLDADVPGDDGFRVVQLTPPGSAASVIFGSNVTAAEPGSADGLILVVDDIDAGRDALVARGVDVSEVFHDAGGVFHHAGNDARVAGPAPERASYGSFASFSDPDGNGWLLQEIRTRLPGR